MNFIDKGVDDYSWKLIRVGKRERTANLTDSTRVKECTCCGCKMLLVNNAVEEKLITKLNQQFPLEIPFEIIGSSKSAVRNKLKKYADTGLPLSCVYRATEYEAPEKYRLSGTFEYNIGKKFLGLMPGLKGICPCCGKKYDEVSKAQIAQLSEADYSKIIGKYKHKVNPESVEVDYSRVDYKEYLSTAIELYQDAMVLEKQIKNYIIKKHVCENEVIKEKGLYYLENKDYTSEEYISSVKRLEELQDELSIGVQLSEEEKKYEWDIFIKSNAEWSVYTTDLEKPQKPVTPRKPKVPSKPVPFIFDESRLVEPKEPTYGVGNFFNKRKVERQNEELKKQYELEMEQYKKACEEFQQLQSKQVKKEKEYIIETETLDERNKRYEEEMAQFSSVKEEYRNKLIAFEKAEKQRQALSLKEEDVKKNIYMTALQKKKAGIIEEIDKEQAFIKDFKVSQRNKREQEANTLPSVISNTTVATIVEDEIAFMAVDLFNIYGAIEELKSLNVIYEKYNQLPALCIIYEYFLSGRVTELEGPYGAYNLYESEMKSNKIIEKLNTIDNKLDTIIRQLDDIKETHMVLYKTMKEINTNIEDMADALDSLSVSITNFTSSIGGGTSRSSIGGGTSSRSMYSIDRSAIENLQTYKDYSSIMSSQHSAVGETVKRASVIKRGIVGAIIAGPAGAIVGALSAIDKNRRS